MSIDFRLFGRPYKFWVSSPAIGEEIILFNMAGLLEFALKAQSTLNVPLPYFAFLYPTTTEYPFSNMAGSWEKIVGSFQESGEVTPEQLTQVSEEWDRDLQENQYLAIWISALANGSEAPEAVQTEFENLPFYANEYVSGGEPLTVEIAEGSERWSNAAGQTLYLREESPEASSWKITLPATENRYEPLLSFSRKTGTGGVDLSIRASYVRQPKAFRSAEEEAAAALDEAEEEAEADVFSDAREDGEEDASGETPEEEAAEESAEEAGGDSEYAEEEYDGYREEGGEEYEEYQEEGDTWPDRLLDISVDASGLPSSLPEDSAFHVSAALRGALFPNFAFTVDGKTKKDGSLSLTVSKPATGGTEPVWIIRCAGSLMPVEPETVPNYRKADFPGAYNLFSLNEEKLDRFKKDITPGLLKTMLAFVAEAPASFVRSILDDLTDIGLLGVFLGQ